MAVVSRWIDLPRTLLTDGPSEPYLLVEELVPGLRKFATGAKATLATVDITGATSASTVIDALKGVLPFPDWCASSWDSIEDAFEEIRQTWSFPLVVIVEGLRSTLKTRPHVGLEVVVRLSDLSRAFSMAGDQLVVIYVADRWA